MGKEKLYEIIMPHTQDEVLAYWNEDDEWEFMYRESICDNDDCKYQFTEKEIKTLDERYLAFKVPVEEEE